MPCAYPVSGFGLYQLPEPVWLMTLKASSAEPVSVAVEPVPADVVLPVSDSAEPVSAEPVASVLVPISDLHI